MPRPPTTCPHCGAPVTAPSLFARRATCAHCGATVALVQGLIDTQRFRATLDAQRDPVRQGKTVWWSIGALAWTPLARIAQGEASDVWQARAVGPSAERVLVKVLRDPSDAPLFEGEVAALRRLALAYDDAPVFRHRMPWLVAYGHDEASGAALIVLRDAPGFGPTLRSLGAWRTPAVSPIAGVWLWRRVLESLTLLHRHGLVHGAVLPRHVLPEQGEHGARLVGFSVADSAGAPLRAVCLDDLDLYPRSHHDGGALSVDLDLRMSARTVAWAIGAHLPGTVPARLVALLEEVGERGAVDAWSLRQRVGQVGRAVFGPPSFQPIVFPSPP